MRAAVRLTAKIERRLKKFERELTRPIPKLTRLNRKGDAGSSAIERASLNPIEEWASFKPDGATNDNQGRTAVRLASMNAPPVALPGKQLKFAAPTVKAEQRAKPNKTTKAPRPKSKNPPEQRVAGKLVVLAAGAFLASFLVFFKIVSHLA